MLDSKETIGSDLEQVDSSICAVLVRRNGGAGAVRLYGSQVENIRTGPDQGSGLFVVVIGPGTCRFFGSPSVRYFRRRCS